MTLIALVFALSTIVSWGSGTRWIKVHLPTHVLYVDEGSSGGMTEVPCVDSSTASFERTIGLLNSPYIPHHCNWNVPADTNLITIYRFSVSGAYDVKSNPKNPKLIITIDLTKALRPEGYPFTVNEVADKVEECVKLNFNEATIVVRPESEKEGEQVGTGQPATRSESDLEGGDKPQPEAEGRSR
jgi:hypothetical protein